MTPLWERFLLSSGFGGLAALLAALVAFTGVLWSVSTTRRTALEDLAERRRARRMDQWWERANWALDLTLSQDEEARVVGFKVLAALAMSAQWSAAHEGDLIAAATDRQLADAPAPVAWTWRGRRSHTGDRGRRE